MVLIEVDQHTGLGSVTLCRNNSLSWQGNKLFFGFMVVVSLTIALMFVLLGAWPILPFAGLELAVLGLCIYLTALRKKDREVIEFSEEQLVLQKVRSAKLVSQKFERADVYFERIESATHGGAAKLHLCALNGGHVEIGIDLAEEEKESLISDLQKIQLTWHNRHINWACDQSGR